MISRTPCVLGTKIVNFKDFIYKRNQMNNPEDDIRYTYKDLLEIGKDCTANGVKAIQVTGWTKREQDSGNPTRDINLRLGPWQELNDVIVEVQKLGVKIILFPKFTRAGHSTDWYKNILIKYATKDPYGYPLYYGGYSYQADIQLANFNTHRFSPICHLSSDWRKIANPENPESISLNGTGTVPKNSAIIVFKK